MMLINPELDVQMHIVFNNLKRSFTNKMNKDRNVENQWDRTVNDIISIKQLVKPPKRRLNSSTGVGRGTILKHIKKNMKMSVHD
jgi:hypothetical protein